MSADPVPAPSSSFLTWSRAHCAWAQTRTEDARVHAIMCYRAYLASLGPDAECWLAPYLAQLESRE